MLFDYTYLLQGFDADFFNGQGTGTAEFIIPVTENITGNRLSVFQTLMQTKNKFCFSLTADLAQQNKAFIKEEIIQHLVRLLFLPNYYRIDGKHVFFIEPSAEDQKCFNSIKNQFYNEFRKQGIEIIIIEILNTLPVSENPGKDKNVSFIHPGLNHYLNNGVKEDSFEIFIKEFSFPEYIDKKMIVPVTDTGDLKNKIKLIEKLETWIKDSEPLEVVLTEMYKGALENGNRLQSENKLLKFKLDNSASYLELIKKESAGLLNHILVLRHENQRLNQQANVSGGIFPELASYADNPDFIMLLQSQVVAQKKRADETLNWYIKEYEVLPKWYKRFGQIIRVLTGKRTFKSLFKKDNNDKGRKNTQ